MNILLLIMLALILGIPYAIYKNYEYKQQQAAKQQQDRISWQNSAIYILKHALHRSAQYFPLPKTENHGFEKITIQVHKQGFCAYYLTYICEPNTPDLDIGTLEQCRNILNTEIKGVSPCLVYDVNVPYVDLFVIKINLNREKLSILVVPVVDAISQAYVANYQFQKQQQAIIGQGDGNKTLSNSRLEDDEL